MHSSRNTKGFERIDRVRSYSKRTGRTQRPCADKANYVSKDAAASALKHMKHRDPGLRVYQCPKCRMWHIGI